MKANILTAIQNIVNSPIGELKTFYESRNRANNMGIALETYIQDVFAGTLFEENEEKRLLELEKAFSYLGNQNNPPDVIIRDGDAIEVKKIESDASQLALNSSYPKAKLYADNPMITAKCRSCEKWSEKDIIYAVGVVNKSNLTRLFFVYGIDYAASASTYERIKTKISEGINAIRNVEFADTKELARVNRVDPLGITYLRIRGMWGIDNPTRVFSKVLKSKSTAKFNFTAIINSAKYDSFPAAQRSKLESMINKSFSIDDIKIKTPDNPSILKDAKLITHSR